jgi:hypothetical protein
MCGTASEAADAWTHSAVLVRAELSDTHESAVKTMSNINVTDVTHGLTFLCLFFDSND